MFKLQICFVKIRLISSHNLKEISERIIWTGLLDFAKKKKWTANFRT